MKSNPEHRIPAELAPILVVTLLVGIARPAAAQLNDTGQVTCYDNGASTGTVSLATPTPEVAGFEGQDCTRGRAAADVLARSSKIGTAGAAGRDYTKISNGGAALPATATFGSGSSDWACTRDNITGLIWEVKVDDSLHLRHVGHRYTWFDADSESNGGNAGSSGSNSCNGTLPSNLCNTTAYKDAVNALVGSARLCGHTDWRLPTRDELLSLVHFGISSSPRIDASFFPNTTIPHYWTGDNFAPDANSGWSVDFFDGSLFPRAKTSGERVRLVRGGP